VTWRSFPSGAGVLSTQPQKKDSELRVVCEVPFFSEAVKSPLDHTEVDKQPCFLITPIEVIKYDRR
jgi:hypothetical protein